jgi:hypothetical protein
MSSRATARLHRMMNTSPAIIPRGSRISNRNLRPAPGSPDADQHCAEHEQESEPTSVNDTTRKPMAGQPPQRDAPWSAPKHPSRAFTHFRGKS